MRAFTNLFLYFFILLGSSLLAQQNYDILLHSSQNSLKWDENEWRTFDANVNEYSLAFAISSDSQSFKNIVSFYFTKRKGSLSAYDGGQGGGRSYDFDFDQNSLGISFLPVIKFPGINWFAWEIGLFADFRISSSAEGTATTSMFTFDPSIPGYTIVSKDLGVERTARKAFSIAHLGIRNNFGFEIPVSLKSHILVKASWSSAINKNWSGKTGALRGTGIFVGVRLNS